MVQGKHWLLLNMYTLVKNNLQVHIKTFTLLYRSQMIKSYKADVAIFLKNPPLSVDSCPPF